MKPPFAGIAAVFVIGLVAGVLTPSLRRPALQNGLPDEVPDLIRAARERQPASLIGCKAPVDLSDHFAGVPPADKGRTLIASAGEIEPADLPGLFAGNREDHTIGRIIAKRWAETDPEGFCDYLKKHPDAEYRRSFDSWEILFRTWGAADPETAFARLLKVPDSAVRRDGLPQLCDTLLHRDVDRALQLIAAHPRFSEFSVILPRSDWIRDDPGGIAAKLRPLPDSLFRERSMETALALWFKKSPEETIAFAATLEGPAALAVRPFVNNWARRDPEAAIAFAAGEIHDGVSTKIVAEALDAWSGHDPIAAWEWTAKNLVGGPRKIARSRVIRSAARADPVAAVEMILTLPEKQQNSELGYFTESFFKADRKAALAWAHDQTDPEIRERVFGRIGHEWVRRGHREMEEYVREHADSLPESFVIPLALRLEGNHPREAMNLQEHLPDRIGIPLSERIMEIWTGRSPESAGAYVLEMEHPEKRRHAFETVAGPFLRNRPDTAVAWLEKAAAGEKISTEQIRNAVTKSSLTPEQRDEVLTRLGLAGGEAN